MTRPIRITKPGVTKFEAMAQSARRRKAEAAMMRKAAQKTGGPVHSPQRHGGTEHG